MPTNTLTLSDLRHEAEKIVEQNELESLESLSELPSPVIRQMLHELHVYQIELEIQNQQLRNTEEALESERQHYFDLYDLAPIGYCTLNQEGVITQANHTCATLLEISRVQLVNQPISKFILKADQDVYYFFRKEFLNTGEHSLCELRMLKSDGSDFWVHLSAISGQDINHLNEVYLVISDMSKYKSMEEKLRLKEEMVFSQSRQAAMGEMMSMIAHQWRQPLNNLALLNQDNYVKMKLGRLDAESFDRSHTLIDENLQFMSKTIDDFRNFFRPDQIKETTTIDEVLQSTIGMVGTSLKNNTIEIILESTSHISLLIHKNSLIHVLLNILGNAKDAFESNDTTQATIMISVDETPKEILISICDNGGGISEEILDQLAQPYFTTKGLSGTGLGLYISRTIIEKYFMGRLEWHNNAANGACFVITLRLEYVQS